MQVGRSCRLGSGGGVGNTGSGAGVCARAVRSDYRCGIGQWSCRPFTDHAVLPGSYVATTGAPIPNWAGIPCGIGAACPAGINDYRSPDGRVADWHGNQFRIVKEATGFYEGLWTYGATGAGQYTAIIN